MKSINIFEEAFLQALNETNVAGGIGSLFGGGILDIGDTAGKVPGSPNDIYAPNDARIPKILGMGKKKKKEKMGIMRRPLPGLGKQVVN